MSRMLPSKQSQSKKTEDYGIDVILVIGKAIIIIIVTDNLFVDHT